MRYICTAADYHEWSDSRKPTTLHPVTAIIPDIQNCPDHSSPPESEGPAENSHRKEA